MSDLGVQTFDGEDLSAGEYALGVLGHVERQAAEARAEREPAFAREVEAWQERLYPMVSAVGESPPPAHIWLRIQRALGPTSTKVVDLGQRRGRGVLAKLGGGGDGGGGRGGGVPGRAPAGPGPCRRSRACAAVQPLLIAELADKNGHGFLTASYDPAKGELHAVPSTAIPVGADRAAELWLIPADGVPRSLGVIDATHPTVVKVSELLRPGAKATAVLAITSEQPGGSPTGKPTTTPKFIGKFTAA